MHKLNSRYEHIGRRKGAGRTLAARMAVFFFVSLALTSPVQANYIQPGKVPSPPSPPKPGPPPPTSFTESYTYTPPGGKAIPFTITVTPGESADDKSDAIIEAITDPKGAVKGSASHTSNTNHPEEVSSGGTIALVKSTSGETDKTFSLGPAGPGSFVAIAFGGDVTGTTLGNGATAMYDASFGFDGLVAQSSFSYDNLFNKTLDGLLTATYDNLLAELPSSLQGNLDLDLATDTIRFDLPSSANDPFVVGDSLDQNLFYSETLVTTAPEPSSLFLVSIGAFWAIASAWLRRRRNRVG